MWINLYWKVDMHTAPDLEHSIGCTVVAKQTEHSLIKKKKVLFSAGENTFQLKAIISVITITTYQWTWVCFASLCITSSLAVDGPVSGPSTLVAGVTLTTECPSESTPPSSAKISTTSTKTFPFQLELLHVQLKTHILCFDKDGLIVM